MEMEIEKLKYPIGKFQKPNSIHQNHIEEWLESISSLGQRLRAICENLEDDDLKKTYRLGSWNIRQLIHHLVDSHINAYVRYKWALTENKPSIKAYNEVKWAELEDGKNAPIDMSLDLLEALHKRWIYSLRSLNDSDFERGYYHPDDKEDVIIAEFIGRYSWHGEHHLAHVKQALDNNY